jgi:ribosomal protein L7/L12
VGNQIRDKLRDISEAVEAGDKIEAIRIYREMTCIDLEEATVAIEDLSASLVMGDSDE